MAGGDYVGFVQVVLFFPSSVAAGDGVVEGVGKAVLGRLKAAVQDLLALQLRGYGEGAGRLWACLIMDGSLLAESRCRRQSMAAATESLAANATDVLEYLEAACRGPAVALTGDGRGGKTVLAQRMAVRRLELCDGGGLGQRRRGYSEMRYRNWRRLAMHTD